MSYQSHIIAYIISKASCTNLESHQLIHQLPQMQYEAVKLFVHIIKHKGPKEIKTLFAALNTAKFCLLCVCGGATLWYIFS